MKKAIVLIGAVGLSMLVRAADAPAPVTYMDATKVAEALAKTGLMKKGDVIIVPANTPHWFKEVTLCNSFMVRVNKP
jgi:hypothetical protein